MVRYSYYELVQLFKNAFNSHPFVNNFYTNKYSLNHIDDIDYAAIIFTTNNINVRGNITVLSFNLMYVDRLSEENDNLDDIYSVGIQVISETINALVNKFDLDIDTNLNFQLFKNQFADRCAGTLCTLSIVIGSQIGECDWLTIKECCCNG